MRYGLSYVINESVPILILIITAMLHVTGVYLYHVITWPDGTVYKMIVH